MQQNYDINSPIAASNEASAGQENAMNSAIGLAKSAQDVQQKQLQTQEMEDKLAMGRAQNLVDRLTTQNKIGDARLRQTYAKMNDQWAQKNGIAYSGFFNDHAGDDAQQRLGPLSDILMGAVKTPEQARAALAAASSPEELDKAYSMLGDQKKQQNAMDIAKAANAAKIEIENKKQETGMYGADQRLKGMLAMAGPRQDRIQQTANRMYSQEMGPSENLLLTANKLHDITKDVDSGQLNSNKTIRSEVQAGIAQMLAGGKPSTVFGQQAVEQDSAYQELKDFQNKYLGEAEGTVPPAQWEQLKKDIAALKSANSDLHEKKYQSFREGLEGAPAQQHLDRRYEKFRSSLGIPGTAAGEQQAAPAAQAPQGADWAAKYKDPVQQKFIQNALSHGYSQSDIEAHLKGGK